MKNILVLCTVNDKTKSEEIASELVKAKLAACVNIIPSVTSIYEWKGEICKDSEYLMIIKSSENLFKDLENCIKSLHPYEVPEIIAIEITNGNKAYMDWLNGNLK